MYHTQTPKMLKTVMTNYLNLVSPDALEFLTPLDLEVIWTATSAANNCEICLSFHAGALLGAEKPADEVATMAAGGVPKDPKMARLVIAAKYVLAHKGILLEREKLHLSSMGFSAEELVEVLHGVLEPRVDGARRGRTSQ
jgi:AhpD family alkylhydroperoxidase